MSTNRTALFVIDIQNSLASNLKTQVPHAERVKEAGKDIIATARNVIDSAVKEGKIPSGIIVFVQHEESPQSGDLVRGSEPWKLVFEPHDKDEYEILVAKTTPDTFESNTQLAERLRVLGVTHLVTFGIQSDCCVEATSSGGLGAAFDVTVLAGAHSTYDDGGKTAVEIERAVENSLAAKGAHVLPWREVVEQWQRTGSMVMV